MPLNRILVAGVVVLCAALAAYGLTHLQFFDPIFGQAEERTLDWRQRAAALDPPRDSSEIRLILLDEVSVEAAPYLSPFPRSVLAGVIEVSGAFGASAIGLDVFLQKRYPDLPPEGADARLRRAIEEAGNVILAAPLVQTDSGWITRRPDPYFADVAAGVGYAEIPTAFDVVTDATLYTRTIDEGLVPGFALAVYARARGLDIDSLMTSIERQGRLELPGLPAEYGTLDEDVPVHNMRILFAGPPSRAAREHVGMVAGAGTGAEAGQGAFLAFSSEAVQALDEVVAIDPGLVGDFFGFAGNIALVGSGFHAEEKFRTPFYSKPDPAGKIYGWTFGTEIHANALQGLLAGRFLTPLPPFRTAFLLLAMAGLVTFITFWKGVTRGAAAALALCLAEMAAAWLAFAGSQLHVPIVGPTLAAGFAFIGGTSYISIIEGREKRMIRNAFSKYVSPVVVDDLVADPSRLKLGGEKRHLSILFSDLAGFTAMSETMAPESLVGLLNEYLDEMADIVMSEGGTLDKYIGDAIMALYGAPSRMSDHAVRVCRTALRMRRRLDQLNEGWAEIGRPRLAMRVGVNTGYPVVGNIGGEKRFDYTALGDAVNLAARLEPACKTYGVDIMISGATRDAAGDAILTRELDLLAVYGREAPIAVHELVGLAGEDPGEMGDLIGHFERGLVAYRDRDFELASQYFQAAAEINPTDGPSLLYMERCRNYIVDPPPAEWDGVERRQIK